MVASNVIAKPVRAFGGFYSMALDTFVAMFRPPFAWREFLVAVLVCRAGVDRADADVDDSLHGVADLHRNHPADRVRCRRLLRHRRRLGTVRQIGPIVTVWWSPAPARPPCAPTWVRGRFARSSTRCG